MIILDLISNRELAFFIWLSIAAIYSLRERNLQECISSILKLLLHKKIIIFHIAMLSYIAIQIFILFKLNIWSNELLLSTFIWLYIPYKFIFEMQTINSNNKKPIIENLKSLITYTAIFEYIINFSSFPLIIELVVVPCLFICSYNFKEGDNKANKKNHKFFTWILCSYILFALSYSIWYLYQDWSILIFYNFIFSLVMSTFFLPFIFILRVYIIYEDVFFVLSMHTRIIFPKVYALKRVIISFGFNTNLLLRWQKHVLSNKIISKQDIDSSILLIKESVRREKNPALVNLKFGWSPYIIKNSLERFGLKTSTYDYYHRGEWCSKADLKIGNFPNDGEITFTINGTQDFATQFSVQLNCINPNISPSQKHDFDTYIKICDILFENAFGDSMPKNIKMDLVNKNNLKTYWKRKFVKIFCDYHPLRSENGDFCIFFTIENLDTMFPE